jgi:hypothetical protein
MDHSEVLEKQGDFSLNRRWRREGDGSPWQGAGLNKPPAVSGSLRTPLGAAFYEISADANLAIFTHNAVHEPRLMREMIRPGSAERFPEHPLGASVRDAHFPGTTLSFRDRSG